MNQNQFENLSPADQLRALGTQGKPKKFGHVNPEEKPKRNYKESKEQGSIAGYLKKYHPDIMFQTTTPEGKKELWQQNQIKKNNSHSGYPDTNILAARAGYNGLMIENKALGTKIFQIRQPNRFASEHLANQYNTHLKLRKQGFAVYFAVGVTDAVKILEAYLSGQPMPMLDVIGFDYLEYLK